MRNSPFFIKLTQWEHWPTFMFYVPLIPYYLFSALKARRLIFFLTINPAIRYSGNGTESKFTTLSLVPLQYRPKTILIKPDIDFLILETKLKKAQITYPLIAKPDIGFRGYLVKKIDSPEILKDYLSKNKIDILLQEYIDLKNECGILYHRVPGETKGKITSLTLKKFLTTKGDGRTKLSALIKSDKRAKLYYNLLENIHGNAMDKIPKKDEIIKLTVIGNHSKGTQFINGNDLITKELELMFDSISNNIKGWNYGRLDIKYDSFDKLLKGESFKILEINGIISEPTHIYDPSNASYLDALKSIKQHWKIMNRIAIVNHKRFSVPTPKILPYLKELLWLRRYSKKIIRLNKIN